MAPKVPDVTYLMNVYERQSGESSEKLVRREIWYYKVADLFALNTDRSKSSPDIIKLPGDLPSDFDWSGKMFDAVLNPTTVTLRIGLIDKSELVPADKCCRQRQTPTAGNDPLPVGYAGFYANGTAPLNKLPSWGILIPVFRPLLNLPLVAQNPPNTGNAPFNVWRVAYYISTADRPSHHADNIKALSTAQKKFVLSRDTVDQPPLSIGTDIDEHGDFINKESSDSFDDMLDNFIPSNDDAQWTGVLFPNAPDPPPFDPTGGQNDTASQIPPTD